VKQFQITSPFYYHNSSS